MNSVNELKATGNKNPRLSTLIVLDFFKKLDHFSQVDSLRNLNLKIDLSDEDIEFLKIHPENYTIINFYSELLLILRFIRNKEANTIGR